MLCPRKGWRLAVPEAEATYFPLHTSEPLTHGDRHFLLQSSPVPALLGSASSLHGWGLKSSPSCVCPYASLSKIQNANHFTSFLITKGVSAWFPLEANLLLTALIKNKIKLQGMLFSWHCSPLSEGCPQISLRV